MPSFRFLFHMNSPARCPEKTFTCDNGECITKINPECDFIRDCADASDEAHCGNHFFDLRQPLLPMLASIMVIASTNTDLHLNLPQIRLWHTSSHGESNSGRWGCSARGAALAGQSAVPLAAHLWSLHSQWALACQCSSLLSRVGGIFVGRGVLT